MIVSMGTERLARFFTDAFSPTNLLGIFLLVTGWQTAGFPVGLVVATVGAGIPGLALEIAHRRGTTDRHVRERTKRGPYILLGCASILAALLLTLALGGPRKLMIGLLFVLAGAIVIGVITRWWKISAHATMAAFTLIPIAWNLHPGGLALLLILVGVAWSRLHLQDHTPPQVLAGTLLGSSIAIAYLAWT